MADTPQRRAWLAGRDAGEADANGTLTPAAVKWAANREMPTDRDLWPAWLNGYGHGISEAAGCIPGHHLSYVCQQHGGGRTELIQERRR